MNTVQSTFNMLVNADIAKDLVSIIMRPTKATCDKLEDRQSESSRTHLGAISSEMLNTASDASPEEYKYIYMITIRAKDISSWLLYDSFTKYLALRNLQVVTKAKDAKGNVVDVDYTSYKNQNNDKESLVTLYVTATSDVVGVFVE
jgi:hypothetical protein